MKRTKAAKTVGETMRRAAEQLGPVKFPDGSFTCLDCRVTVPKDGAK